jgi:predicted outer membrane repeat protein
MKTLRTIISALALTSLLLAGSFGQTKAIGLGIIYVDKDVHSGLGDGSSWADAYSNLQSALLVARSGDEIWVADGTYYPTSGTDRAATFTLINGVVILGGFDGTETLHTQRAPNTKGHTAILSGDIGVSGDPADNSYHVVTGGGTNNTAVLDGFIVTAGNANSSISPDYDGGGMYNSNSNPSLANVIFSSNTASEGGGLYNGSSNPSLTNVTFSGNSADYGGGMNNSNSNPSLTNVTFSSNTATLGGGILNYGGSPALTNVTFNNNSATNQGGGIFNDSSSPTLANVTFNTNTATSYGGGMKNQGNSNPGLTNVSFNSNSAYNGGAMCNGSSSPNLTNVTFSGNTATYGGGMYNRYSSNPSLTNVTFNNNSATHGGGMHNEDDSSPSLTNVIFDTNSATGGGGGMSNYTNSNPILTNNTFSSNSAFAGGGIFNDNSSPSLVNVTFNTNSATGGGGGMSNDTSNPSLTNVTFSGNSATSGVGGIHNYNSSPVIKNSLFWGNSTEFEISTGSAPQIDDSLIQGGCPAGATCNANIINADPLLGSLADNGGFTKTMALGEHSPAMDTGNNATCASTDQRGIKRPQGIRCDMGAYEIVITTTPVSVNSTSSQDGWILESSETSKKGGTKNTTATTLRIGDDAAKKQYRDILSFNTGSILPDDAVVMSATLKVRRQGVVGGGNPVTMFQGFMVDIKKGTLGTSSLVISDFQASASKSYGPFKPALSGGWYKIVLSSAGTYVNAVGLTQIRLRFKLDDNNNTVANYLSLYSGNASTSYRPQLIVEYYVP